MKSRPLGKDAVKTISGIKMPEQLAKGKRRSMEEILQEQGLLDEKEPSKAGAPVTNTQEQDGTEGHADKEAVLSIEQIDPSPYQPRKIFDQERIEELADSILNAGRLWNPITVRQKADGRFELIGGERRLRAHRLLGWKDISARIMDLDDASAEVMALADNTGAEPLTGYEQAVALKRIVEKNPDVSIGQISRITGINKGNIHKDLCFFKLPEPVIEIMERAPATLLSHHAYELSLLADEYPDWVTEAVEAVDAGKKTPTEAIRWLKSRVKASDKPAAQTRKVVPIYDKKRSVNRAIVSGKTITLHCTSKDLSDEVLNRIIDALGMQALDSDQHEDEAPEYTQ